MKTILYIFSMEIPRRFEWIHEETISECSLILATRFRVKFQSSDQQGCNEKE